MKWFVGLDVHKHFVEVCVIDGKGKVLFRGRVHCGRDELLRFATKELHKTDCVVLEATTNTWPVVEILRPHVAQVVVGNPVKTKAIADTPVPQRPSHESLGTAAARSRGRVVTASLNTSMPLTATFDVTQHWDTSPQPSSTKPHHSTQRHKTWEVQDQRWRISKRNPCWRWRD